MIIHRTNAHYGAGLPTGISVTYESINGADSLALLFVGVRFTGRVHYLIAMTINYVNYAVDKQFCSGLTHFNYITFSLHYCTKFWCIRWALLNPNIQQTKETIQCFFVWMKDVRFLQL
jgi:hypothetical protein